MKTLAKFAAVAAVAAPLAVGGCKSSSSSGTPASPSGLAHGSPLASIPGADKQEVKLIINQCFPVKSGAADQIKFATELVNDTKAHGNGSRDRVLTCVGVSQDPVKRQAALDALLTDLEHVRWNSKAARAQFYGGSGPSDLPAWVTTSRAAAS